MNFQERNDSGLPVVLNFNICFSRAVDLGIPHLQSSNLRQQSIGFRSKDDFFDLQRIPNVSTGDHSFFDRPFVLLPQYYITCLMCKLFLVVHSHSTFSVY